LPCIVERAGHNAVSCPFLWCFPVQSSTWLTTLSGVQWSS
jgi:hypothetical protein